METKTLGETLAPSGPPPGGYLTGEQVRLLVDKTLTALYARIVAAYHLAAMAAGRLQ